MLDQVRTRILIPLILSAAVALPGAALAAGSSTNSPPTPTETTTKCKKGEIWDDKTKKCVAPQSGALDNDQRFAAVRELAYAGRPREALAVLDTMTEGNTDRVLTYRAFAWRKAGDVAKGMGFYQEALAQNPDNLLARSYMGQAYVEAGNIKLAQVQLDEIVARGGTGGWPETSLRKAIATGEAEAY